MKKLLLTHITTLFLFFNFHILAYAETNAELSFNTFKACRMPPISPSKKLLARQYKTYIYAGNWKIFDINGDGWCDWVRGGHQGYRTDNEEPPMRDFIYIGTGKGWRHFDQQKNDQNSERKFGDWRNQNILFGSDTALAFYQPIAIYRNGQAKPYVVSVSRYDAPAPPPDRDAIQVFRWDDQMDKLVYVPEVERTLVVDFLHDQLCKYPAALLAEGGEPFMIAQGELCHPKQ